MGDLRQRSLMILLDCNSIGDCKKGTGFLLPSFFLQRAVNYSKIGSCETAVIGVDTSADAFLLQSADFERASTYHTRFDGSASRRI